MQANTNEVVHNSTVARALDAWDDMWHRRNTLQVQSLESAVFGFPLSITTNSPAIAEACQLGLARFTRGPSRPSEAPITLRLFAREAARDPLGQVGPGDLASGLAPFSHDGYEDLIAIDLGVHGHCSIDLGRRTALGFLSHALADCTEVVARFIVCTTLLNILTRCDLIQWHAAAVIKGDAALLLVGADNSGKSTTALALVRAGYRLLAESLTYARQTGEGFELMGFPVGQLRLRPAALGFFPGWGERAERHYSADGEKWVLDLRALAPDSVVEDSWITQRVVLGLVRIGGGERTTVRSLTAAEALTRAIPACSLWEAPSRAGIVLRDVQRMVEMVPCYEIAVGSELRDLVGAVDRAILA